MSVATATKSQPAPQGFPVGTKVVFGPTCRWNDLPLAGVRGVVVERNDFGVLVEIAGGHPTNRVMAMHNEVVLPPKPARLTEVQEGGKRFYALRSAP